MDRLLHSTFPLEGKKYSPSVERKVRRNALRCRCRSRRWSGRRGAGAHILFARSVLLGLGPTVKDHPAVARSAPTFDGKSLARMMPASPRPYILRTCLSRKPTFNTYAYGPLLVVFAVILVSVLPAGRGPSVVATVGNTDLCFGEAAVVALLVVPLVSGADAAVGGLFARAARRCGAASKKKKGGLNSIF